MSIGDSDSASAWRGERRRSWSAADDERRGTAREQGEEEEAECLVDRAVSRFRWLCGRGAIGLGGGRGRRAPELAGLGRTSTAALYIGEQGSDQEHTRDDCGCGDQDTGRSGTEVAPAALDQQHQRRSRQHDAEGTDRAARSIRQISTGQEKPASGRCCRDE